MSNTPLPEPAFGFLVVSGETGQWIGSRAGEAAFDADNLHAHAAAVSAERDAEIAGLRADYERACKLAADMHAAAMGANVGPVLGVVEDVAALRERVCVLEDALKAANYRTMVDARISYRGYSYGMGSTNGITDLRRAIERDGNG